MPILKQMSPPGPSPRKSVPAAERSSLIGSARLRGPSFGTSDIWAVLMQPLWAAAAGSVGPSRPTSQLAKPMAASSFARRHCCCHALMVDRMASRLITTKDTIDVAAALVFRDGKLLVTKRHDDVHLGGFWEFPGGKREPNESFEDCLVRELREELGIEVTVGELVESLTHPYPERTVHLRFFRCVWTRHEPQRLGCVDL